MVGRRPDPLGRLLGAEPPRGEAKWDFLPALVRRARAAGARQPQWAQARTLCFRVLFRMIREG